MVLEKYTRNDGEKSDDSITSLFEAVKHKDLKSVSQCLRNGGNVHARYGTEGYTLLHCAAKYNFRKVALKLLKYGADVNAKTTGGRTVLQVAIMYNASGVVSVLLKKGADVSAVDSWGRSALHFAANYNSEALSRILRLKRENVNKGDNWLLFPLHLAAMGDNPDAVRILVQGGACINAANENSRSPLHLAARFSCTEAALELMKCGADIDLTDSKHCTALHNAARSKNGEIIEELIKRGATVDAHSHGGRTALHVAASVDSKQVVAQLLRHGADINASDDYGSSPLHVAAMCNSREVAAMLLHNKADASLMDSLGHTALHLAASRNKIVVVNALLQADPSLIKLENKFGQTALHVSASAFSENMVRLLLQKQVNINAVDHQGNTALHYALAAEKRNGIVSHLLEQNTILLNLTDRDSNCFLHLWARLLPPNFDFITYCGKLLIQAGAVVNARNSYDQTPLHLAATWEAASLLVEHGAWINVGEMHSGETPLLSRVKSLQENSHFTYEQQNSTETQTRHWQKLLEKGFDPWIADSNGETALSVLLTHHNVSLAKSLLEVLLMNQKDVNKKHTNGLTILHIICSLGNDELQGTIDNVLKLRANVNVINFNGETPLHLVCRGMISKYDQQNDLEQTMFYWTATHLLSNRADPYIEDNSGKSCLDIVQSCPTILSLLKKPVDESIIPPLLKWSDSKSEMHKGKVAQVVRGINCRKIHHYHYHKQPIGSGAFGYVFSGIDEQNGREVAIKRIEKQRLLRHEERREISILVKLRDCDEVVRYISHCEDDNFVYLILDLMEGMLDEYLESSSRDSTRDVVLCMDLVKGLSFLHQHNILHRDIKPGNVLYKTSPRLCLKVADFGLSRRTTVVDGTTTTCSVLHNAAGTRCWMAPELLQRALEVEHSEMSDVFSCGLVIHYILTGKKHPFAPSRTEGRSGIDIRNETERNIINFKLVVDKTLPREAVHLISSLLHEEKSCRPAAQTLLGHPLFWSKTKKARFLEAVGNQPEIQKPRHAVVSPSAVEMQLENTLGKEFDSSPWDSSIVDEYVEMTCFGRGRRYSTYSAVELIRFVRNSYAHVSDASRSVNIKKRLLEDFVYFKVFPSMLMDVYKAVTKHGWDKERDEIMRVLDKE